MTLYLEDIGVPGRCLTLSFLERIVVSLDYLRPKHFKVQPLMYLKEKVVVVDFKITLKNGNFWQFFIIDLDLLNVKNNDNEDNSIILQKFKTTLRMDIHFEVRKRVHRKLASFNQNNNSLLYKVVCS